MVGAASYHVLGSLLQGISNVLFEIYKPGHRWPALFNWLITVSRSDFLGYVYSWIKFYISF